jgi:hypothetical protein
MIEKYSREEFIFALYRIKDKYPASFIHFVMAELDPQWYAQFIANLGKENDSRQSDSGLGQEQEANSR